MSRFKSNQVYISGGDMSNATPPDARSAATIVGPWIRLEDMDSIGFQIKWPLSGTTSATTGTFQFEITNDDVPDGTRGGLGPQKLTTVPADLSAANPAGGTSGSGQVTMAGANCPRAKWGRLTYTRTSGGAAGTLNVSLAERGT